MAEVIRDLFCNSNSSLGKTHERADVINANLNYSPYASHDRSSFSSSFINHSWRADLSLSNNYTNNQSFPFIVLYKNQMCSTFIYNDTHIHTLTYVIYDALMFTTIQIFVLSLIHLLIHNACNVKY